MVVKLLPVCLSLCGLASACVAPTPPPARLTPVNLESPVAETEYLTAREGWLLAREVVKQTAKDAHLIQIEGHWIEAGGRSRDWNYHFYSADRGLRLVIQAGALNLSATETSMPANIDLNRWRFDSDAALALLDAADQIAYPLNLMLLDKDLIWRISGPAGQWQLDAVSGRLLL